MFRPTSKFYLHYGAIHASSSVYTALHLTPQTTRVILREKFSCFARVIGEWRRRYPQQTPAAGARTAWSAYIVWSHIGQENATAPNLRGVTATYIKGRL